MKKYKITTAEKAVEKALVKVGDEIWVKGKVCELLNVSICVETQEYAIIYCENTTIRIPIPEPKPIDFNIEGRILKYKSNLDGRDVEFIVKTTGYQNGDLFGAYIIDPLNSGREKGFAKAFSCIIPKFWQDITDTYKPE